MENIFSNLIIPRINLNSEESLVSAVSLIRDYGFDSFILFATDKVTFGERERFTLNRLSETRKILDSVSKKKVLFFLVCPLMDHYLKLSKSLIIPGLLGYNSILS